MAPFKEIEMQGLLGVPYRVRLLPRLPLRCIPLRSHSLLSHDDALLLIIPEPMVCFMLSGVFEVDVPSALPSDLSKFSNPKGGARRVKDDLVGTWKLMEPYCRKLGSGFGNGWLRSCRFATAWWPAFKSDPSPLPTWQGNSSISSS